MKELKHATRSGNQPPVRSVRLQIRGYQVTVKVKTAVPQTPSAKPFRPAFRWCGELAPGNHLTTISAPHSAELPVIASW